MIDNQAYLPRPQVAQRYGVHERTIDRWEKTYSIGFPTALILNGRRFFSIAALEQWERSRAAAQVAAA